MGVGGRRRVCGDGERCAEKSEGRTGGRRLA